MKSSTPESVSIITGEGVAPMNLHRRQEGLFGRVLRYPAQPGFGEVRGDGPWVADEVHSVARGSILEAQQPRRRGHELKNSRRNRNRPISEHRDHLAPLHGAASRDVVDTACICCQGHIECRRLVIDMEELHGGIRECRDW